MPRSPDTRTTTAATSTRDDSGVAQATDSLFARLAEEALTADGLAVWIGSGTERGDRVGSIGPSLYGGTAGLALAFARYAVHRSQDWAMDIACMAARHAALHAEMIPSKHRFGFYGGWAGIAYALAETGRLANDADEVLVRARRIVADLAGTAPSGEFDVVSGDAGAVAALALAAPSLGESALEVSTAAALRLCGTATRVKGNGLAWHAPGERAHLPLTGFAHGTAGAAWSLLLLTSRADGPTDAARFVETADAAFTYEDSLFDPLAANWPDLRQYRSWTEARRRPPPRQVAWCHGAGGIALARHYAASATGRRTHARIARTAATTVAAATDRMLGNRNIPDSLEMGSVCHGLGGNRVVLATVRDASDGSDALRTRLDNALITLAMTIDAGRGSGLEPGLMCGRAGLGLCLMSMTGDSTLGRVLGSPASSASPQ